MAKSPLMGRAKRRLAREIGDANAIRLYRSCLAHTLLRLGSDRRWRTVLAVTPDRDIGARFWPAPRWTRPVPQGTGDLGRRMQRLFARRESGPVIIVGSDIPSLRASHVAEAFKLLGRADAVLGPAPDGGYWLIGLKRRPRLLAPFAGVRWSSSYAFADTVANLDGRSIALAVSLGDVDTAKSYRAHKAMAERLLPIDQLLRICAVI
jgi:uncharacterized protein